MTQQYYSLITNNGLLKEAAANSSGGSLVELTHIAIGDGNGISYDPDGAQTDLVNELYRTTLTSVVIDENNPNQLIVEGIISEEVGSFYIREVGIFDADGELFAIGKYPETFKSTSESGSGKRLYIRMILGFTNAPQVTLVMSEDLNNDPNFNSNVIASLAEKLAKAENLADLENIEEARVNLGLEIGTDIQAFAANLAAFAALVGDVGKIPYFTNAGELALVDKGYQFRSIQIFTSSGVWNKPLGCKAVLVELVGGGGSGGNSTSGGTGGGGGGYSKKFITSELGDTEIITIGNGATAVGNGNIGNNGSTTSFGSHFSATGGTGGKMNNGAGIGSGGIGVGGDINISGGHGGMSIASGLGGYGGSSMLSNISSGAIGGTPTALLYGCGSGGSTGGASSNGAPGVVIVYEYY